MSEEQQEIKKRLQELADRAYMRGRCVFTTFLSAFELSVFHAQKGAFSYASPVVFGGYEGAERAVIRFGEGDEPFPVIAVSVVATNEKFAEDLSHRDYLGALMNLGVDRSCLGDIQKIGKFGAVVYCLSSMAEYIVENLKRVSRTDVACTIAESHASEKTKLTEEQYFLSSFRADCLVSAVYRLSRDDAKRYFDNDRVFVNGVLCSRASKELSVGDSVTVRGKGRFLFASVEGESKKGRYRCKVKR